MARLVLGTNINNTGTSSTVVEKPVPMPLSVQFGKDINGNMTDPSTVIDLSGITVLQGNNACIGTYYKNPNIVGHIDLSSITEIKALSSGMVNYVNSFAYMFSGCTGITSVDLSNLTTLNSQYSYACRGMFQDCTGITGNLDLSSLTTLNGNSAFMSMFQGCTGITSVDLSGLVEIKTLGNNVGNSMFEDCTGLTSFNMNNLEKWYGYWHFSSIFRGCTSLTEARFPKLKYIGGATGNWFINCTNLTTVDFSAVESITGQMCMYHTFENCTSLKTLSFPSLKTVNQTQQYLSWQDMLKGCTDVVVHFPSNLENIISSWTETQKGFSGTNTTVLFDLPATE